MSRKHVKNDIMDSGLGSDEDRRGSRTKEQKQLHNQQLLSGCFIDAASLSDEAEVIDQRRNDERRQGALIFQSSIPNFSMLQMSNSSDEHNYPSTTSIPNFPETSTPYNSIVHLDTDDHDSARNKSPLGFYVDLSSVPDVPKTPPNGSAKKNIFSMVIDFEGPKKDKPLSLSSSLVCHKSKNKQLNKAKCNGSLSSSVSSVNSCVASTSRQSEEREIRPCGSKDISRNIEVLSAVLVKNVSISSTTSSESDRAVVDKCEECQTEEEQEDIICGKNIECGEDENRSNSSNGECKDEGQIEAEIKKCKEDDEACPQYVKLSDLECQKPKVDINFTPRMSRSIPESHWVESPFLMSRSAGYRSAPHPMEPENSETTSDSDSIMTNSSVSQPKKAVKRLGTDLLRMFLEEIGPDVTVEVEGHKLKAHKCILASRCQYFAALVSGNWLEKSGNVISMQGFSYESVYFALCHIYSGAAHVPDSISLVELASLADMLGLEGLKEVVEHALKQRHCHNFHKPCAGCCTGVLEVLPLSAAYGLDDLYQKCLSWITQHFVRVWPSRSFASLPRELREKCYQQHVVHMTPDKVLETVLACDKVLATLPTLRWAEPISQLVLQLADACHLYHRQHYSQVLGCRYFVGLDTGLGFGVCQVEDQMLSAAKSLGVDQACRSYARCCRMLDQRWSRPFADLLNKVKVRLEQCLLTQADRLIRSQAWLRLDTALRQRIKELSPAVEPPSRLPRAAPLRHKKVAAHSPAASSSESSRNSSPGMSQQMRLGAGGSPSLRRSLLLAAKAPQVPPSPSTARRSGSTLTQPTAASAAKTSRTVKSAPPRQQTAPHPPVRPPLHQPKSMPPPKAVNKPAANGLRTTVVQKSFSQGSVGPRNGVRGPGAPLKRQVVTVSRNSSVGKKEGNNRQLNKALSPMNRAGSPLNRAVSPLNRAASPSNRSASPLNRAASPLRPDSRAASPRKPDSRTGSPRKVDSRLTSPMKETKSSPKKAGEQSSATLAPTMTRSGTFTFLKDEPTILGKIA